MKAFRHIILFLSILVILGHDFVPHSHRGDSELAKQTTEVSSFSHDHSSLDFQDAFSHFQHSNFQNTLVFLGELPGKDFPDDNTLGLSELAIVSVVFPQWQVSYQQRPFRSISDPLNQEFFFSFSLRGPPTS
ncbi:hypothetical protein [Sediminibacterium ginsengisoli]|uniref:hypothetical protein n=1 Tax=Sediminibacterium ginsengisoli TaxID=413434 RepID=UPI0011165330|nr:hypothetical protein [Sediminibacterium ginsengisoli]